MKERVVIGDFLHPSTEWRDTVHREGLTHYCVHLLCYDKENVFLQRRAATRSRNAGCWTSTVSGHITQDDATRGTRIVLDTNVALVSLAHETREELGFQLSLEKAECLGQVLVTSRGSGEICICRTFVFHLQVDHVPSIETPEVAEIGLFKTDDVMSALQHGRGLIGNDRRRHKFADNFAPVFERFVTVVAAERRGA